MHSIVRKVGKGSSVDLTMSVTTEIIKDTHFTETRFKRWVNSLKRKKYDLLIKVCLV